MNIMANHVGFYDRPDQPVDQPTYNPPLDAPCPFCDMPLTMEDMRTIALMYVNEVLGKEMGEIVGVEGGGARSYFYRVHRTCHEAATSGERDALDGLAFRAVEALPGGWRRAKQLGSDE
jgi:hypothetical protein